MPARDDKKSVVINGKRYPLAAAVERSQLGIYDRKFIVGDAQFDSDSYQSALILSNLTGGIGIEDSDEGADTTRFWFGIMDTRSPRMIGLPPLVHEPSSPQAGAARPIGVVGTQFYMAFDDDAYGWNDATGAWHGTANALRDEPVNKSVNFDGNVWIPCGGDGICRVTETTAASGTLTIAGSAATPEAAALALWNNRLYALATDGDLWSLTVGSTTWAQVQNSASVTLKINTGETPKNLVTYFNRQGEPVLWAITDRAAYMFYEAKVEWMQSNIVFPPHPDFGRSACVWRTGEDLWITAGMDVVRQTTGNAIVPLGSGLSRDQGVPQEYRGTIVDLQPEISHLYALVGGTTQTATTYAYSAKVENSLTDPRQVALDSSGNIYVADNDNDKVQKFNSAGVHQSDIITGVDDVTGICVDGSGNIYVSFLNGSNDWRARKYNSSGTLQWTSATLSTGNQLRHLATDGTSVFVANRDDVVQKLSAASGALSATIGSFGTADGQFANPHGIAYSSVTGNIYIVDSDNDRVQEMTTAGVFVRKWGSSGTSNGQFSAPTGIAVGSAGHIFVADSGRDDVQMFTSAGAFVRKFGEAGTGNGQLSVPDGLAVEADDDVWVSDNSTTDRIQKFVATTAVSASSTSYPSLHAWPGTGWHGLWHVEDASVQPTWMTVSAATAHYRLWWGDSAGQSYWMKLFRGFENPNQARLSGSAEFAASGFWLSSKFDAGMLGFPKVASHVVLIPITDSISATETITVEFSIDDGGWETLGTVNAASLTADDQARFSFGASGRIFNTIRFRCTGARGSTTSLSPFLRSLTLLFVKVPQAARSLVFQIAPGSSDYGDFGNRTGQTMFAEIDALADAKTFFDVSYNGLTFTHCRFAGSTGQDNISDSSGKRVVSIIELPTGVA